jgi:hypothetical protein
VVVGVPSRLHRAYVESPMQRGEMPKFIRRSGRAGTAAEETSTGVVVRPPLGKSAVVPRGAELAGYRIAGALR